MLVLKSQQRFKSQKHCTIRLLMLIANKVSANNTNMVVNNLSNSDDKGTQSIDSRETYAYARNKDIMHKNKEMK